jgi:hypothetical protein
MTTRVAVHFEKKLRLKNLFLWSNDEKHLTDHEHFNTAKTRLINPPRPRFRNDVIVVKHVKLPEGVDLRATD